jgi:Fe-S-cluster-containing hydrogenase component 2
MIRSRVVAEPDKCCGCRVCEMVCSLRHAEAFGPHYSAIHRITVTPDLRFDLRTCLQCPTMPCAQACPVGAITRDPDSGAAVVDADRCELCGACVEACPLGQLAIAIVDGRVLKCDLCGGQPACVRWCPRGALSVMEHVVEGT